MAFDGITIAAMVKELKDNLSGGRFNKIAQPEADELMITAKGGNGQRRLLMSASASLPLIYFTDKNKISPMTAPNFCMLLRKHIGSAKIISISQPEME
ncbi:MAG: NFACT family protein, partial [Clostridiales bacterium]|nr:NFACT family protein [Candidatus Blautia equi]